MSDLYDKAAKGREVGMETVDANAADEWKEYADEFIEEYLMTHPTMHVDELWDAGLVTPPSARALGPRMLAALRKGFMVRTGRSKPSVRSHLSDKPVWLSLIYVRTHE